MIEIQCLEENIGGKLYYIGYITFEQLSKHSQLKPLTVNRITDDNRITDMKDYISKNNSFYPPIVLALNDNSEFEYNRNRNTLSIDLQQNINPLVIIDGQHRYKSIKALIDDRSTYIQNATRRQAVYIVTNMSETEQRNIFMQINETMKQVSNVSRRIFKIEIPNYISLKTVKDLNIVKMINFKNDQCTIKYPYKFIIEGNRQVFSYLNYADFDSKTMSTHLDKYSKISSIIWKSLLGYIETNTKLKVGIIEDIKLKEKNVKFIKTEAFINAFFKYFIDKQKYLNNINIECFDYKQLKADIDNIIKLISDDKFLNNEEELVGTSKKEKENKILEILNQIGE